MLSEQTAYALARMETALQERLANMLPNLPTGAGGGTAGAGQGRYRLAASLLLPRRQPLQAGETRSSGMIWTASTANCARAKPAASNVIGAPPGTMPVSGPAPRPRPPGRRSGTRRRPGKPSARRRSRLEIQKIAAPGQEACRSRRCRWVGRLFPIYISDYGRSMMAGKLVRMGRGPVRGQMIGCIPAP